MVGETRPVKLVILGTGGRLGAALARTWAATDEILGFARADIDFLQPGEIARVLEPLAFDALVNCAALTNVDYCETHEEEAMRVNTGAVAEIGALCARKRARCLHISTDYVFDGETDRPYTETDPARAISVYGESKLRGEQALLEASGAHLAVRVSWVFGPDRPSFIDGILKRALESDSAEAIGDKWSAPSFTLDLAAMLRPFLRDIACGGLLHASNSGACTWREYGEYALQSAARAGIPVKTTQVRPLPLAGMKAFVARRPVYTVLSTEKLATLTGAHPRSWQSAVEDYIATHLAPRLAKG
jgi:dTDP-4-dehydrorhamnose reductase